MFLAINSKKQINLVKPEAAIRDLNLEAENDYYEIDLSGRVPVLKAVTIKSVSTVQKSVRRTVVEANGAEVASYDEDE